MKTKTCVRLLAWALSSSLLALTAGCESGKEVATVGTATATRDAQDHVTVAAELKCELVYGQPRASGCDADDEWACLRADWYDATDTSFQHSLGQARTCAKLGSVQSAKMQATSEGPIAKDPPKKIRVQTEPELDSRDDRPTPVIIDSP